MGERAMVSSESREKEQKEQIQAPRAEASVVGGIIKWAKDHGFYQTISDVIQGAFSRWPTDGNKMLAMND